MKAKEQDLQEELYRLVDRLVEVERKLVKSEITAEEMRVEKDTTIHEKNLEIISLQHQINQLNSVLSRKSYQIWGNIESTNFARRKVVRVFLRKSLNTGIKTYQGLRIVGNKFRTIVKILPKPGPILKSDEPSQLDSKPKSPGKGVNKETATISAENGEILSELYSGNLEKSRHYEEFDQSNIFNKTSPVTKLLAFYLPQFHPIKENDLWWGKGFTEWANVSKALPLFKGHYQPRLPGELGYYDLRVPDVQKRQVELAKIAGINAFCVYFYWFNGQTLLEKPLKQLFEDKSLDIDYCLCWANENWTRAWDGLDKEVLIEQKYSKENNLNFIKYISKYFSDKRYIRIDGKPVLLIYRINHFPRPGETIKLFRDYCLENGIGEIYIAGVQGFGMKDPTLYGCDASVEFPPHSIGEELSLISKKAQFGDKKFKGVSIYDIKELIKSRRYIKNDWSKMFRGVMLNWDNTPRKAKLGSVFYGLTPALYQEWLTDAIRLNNRNKVLEEKLLFLNAWNEWGEGSYLEPDKKFGYAFLNATKRALVQSYLPKKKIVCIGHDAHLHGAQQLLLAIVKELKLRFSYDIEVILLEGGVLQKEYENYAEVNVVKDWSDKKLERHFSELRQQGFDDCIFNTTITGKLAGVAKEAGFKFISLIHELPGIIHEKDAVASYKSLVKLADKVVVASSYVKKENEKAFKIKAEFEILPQGIYKEIPKIDREETRNQLRESLSIPEKATIMTGVGYGDERKGIDIFVETALAVCKQQPDIYFIWVGNLDENFVAKHELRKKIEESGLAERIRLIEYSENIMDYFAASDAYLLTSREDPFPSVVLEAMVMGNPVIAFESSGGFSEFINKKMGRLVAKEDKAKLAETILELANKKDMLAQLGQNAKQQVQDKFLLKDYVYSLLDLLGHHYKKVSAAVPNYNYADYLPERIKTITDQTYPLYELILLDDASTDNSKEVIAKIQQKNSFYNISTDFNQQNSGKVYKQWIKAMSIATGDYLWIAEADDLAEKTFLEEVIKGFYLDQKVVLSYTQSKNINKKGRVTAENMRFYTADIDKDKFKFNYLNSGINEIKTVLSVKNTIPNVSGVVFARKPALKAMQGIDQYDVAGDWQFYLNLLKKDAWLYFNASSLNMNRRHDRSVVASKQKNQKHFDEIVQVQEYCIKEFDLDQKVVKTIKDYRAEVKQTLLG